MSGPKPSALTTTPRIRGVLENLARSRQIPASLVQRSQLILSMLDGANNAVAARQFEVHLDTPRLWRARWLELSPKLEALQATLPPDDDAPLRRLLAQILKDQPRPGTPAQFTPEQVTAIIALACEDPKLSGHSFDHWTSPELRLEVLKRGIATTISLASIKRFLKRGGYQTTS